MTLLHTHPECQRFLRYGLAVVSSLLALLLALELAPFLDPARYSLLFGAVLLSAWRGGAGPGIVAAVGTTILAEIFLMPDHIHTRLGVPIHVSLWIYLGIALLTNLLLASLRRTSNNLRESERKFRVLFEKSADAMLVSRDGLHVIANPAYLSLFGYDSEAPLVGMPVTRVIAGRHQEVVQDHIQRQCRGEPVPARFETLGLRRDGAEFDLEIDVTSFDLNNQLYQVVLLRDITRIKRAQQLAESQTAELERQVAERTAQLQAANKELEAFSYSVSHDLRAPLRGIQGYVLMIQEDHAASLSVEALQLFEVIRNNARRMDQLIQDLLEFSSLTRCQPNLGEVDMRGLAQSVARELSQAERDRTVAVVVDDLPPARGDPALMRQVLMNLISNAIKFTRDTPAPNIEVRGAIDAGERHYQVRDNGVGFDMRYADKLFQVFQRLHRTDEFEGTGIGLAIVQRIITRHGGRVWAEAHPQQGACFHFTLPG